MCIRDSATILSPSFANCSGTLKWSENFCICSTAVSYTHLDVYKRQQQGYEERKDFPEVLPQGIWDKVNVQRFSMKNCGFCEKKCKYYKVRAALKFKMCIRDRSRVKYKVPQQEYNNSYC